MLNPAWLASGFSKGFRHCSSSSSSSVITVAAAVQAVGAELKASGVPEPELSAAHLTAAVLGDGNLFSRVSAMHSTTLDEAESAMLQSFVVRRKSREPVQQIVGEWEFHEIVLETARGILVPRPETEELVELCLRDLQSCAATAPPEQQQQQQQQQVGDSNRSGVRVLDVGVGTGAIGLALLNARPDLYVDGIDLDPVAVALSLRNAENLGVDARYSCLEMDVKDAVALLRTTPARTQTAATARPVYDMIVSNPPYIPEADAANMQPEVLLYEKETALFSGELGIDCIEVLLSVAPSLLAPGGSLWLEIDPSQPTLIEQTAAAAKGVPLKYIAAHKDFRGLDRFVHLIKT